LTITDGASLFATKVAQAKTKAAASPTSKLASQRAILKARPFAGDTVEQLHMLQRSIGNQATLRLLAQQGFSSKGNKLGGNHEQKVGSETLTAQAAKSRPLWDFSKILVFSPDRASRPQTSSPVAAIPLPGAIQAKLVVGPVNDPLEHEADRVADQVMRMRDPELSIAPGPEQVTHKCAACEGEEKVQKLPAMGGSAQAATTEVPPIVDEVLRSSGKPLDAATRAFIEQRLGQDFSQVRVHDNAKAAESAYALNARAYTVGRDIVFGAGQYQPRDASGQRLLAHELVHVAQQNSASVPLVQRVPCRSPAQCAAPTPGGPGQFSVAAAAEEAAGQVGPDPCQNKPRHKDRATNLEALVLGAGLGVAIPPQVHGVFINKCLVSSDGETGDCTEFPGGAPPGAPAGKLCIGTLEAYEDRAKALIAKPQPLSGADRQKEVELSALIQHESQHARFDTAAAAIVPAAADCSVATVVPDSTTVAFQLSEMSADMAEFDIYFKNRKIAPSGASIFRLQTAEHDIATRGGENILGAIKTVQCVCACNTVDTFIEKVFNDASSSWTPEEKTEFQKAMTGFMPSFWPKSLQKK
jgi:hypothetical protein